MGFPPTKENLCVVFGNGFEFHVSDLLTERWNYRGWGDVVCAREDVITTESLPLGFVLQCCNFHSLAWTASFSFLSDLHRIFLAPFMVVFCVKSIVELLTAIGLLIGWALGEMFGLTVHLWGCFTRLLGDALSVLGEFLN
jgi:hypothetical protein